MKKSFVGLFNLADSHWMVGCCSRLLDISNGIQLLDQVRLKALALITVYAHQKPIVYEKVIEYLPFGGSVWAHARRDCLVASGMVPSRFEDESI